MVLPEEPITKKGKSYRLNIDELIIHLVETIKYVRNKHAA